MKQLTMTYVGVKRAQKTFDEKSFAAKDICPRQKLQFHCADVTKIAGPSSS